jgi:hypothetical protein
VKKTIKAQTFDGVHKVLVGERMVTSGVDPFRLELFLFFVFVSTCFVFVVVCLVFVVFCFCFYKINQR